MKWSTRDGTAKGSEPGAATKGDFEKSSGELVFTDGENFQSITVTVYDDVETEIEVDIGSPARAGHRRHTFLLRC